MSAKHLLRCWSSLLLLLVFSISLQAQEEAPVEVADLSLSIAGGEVKELYYGFAEGDRIVVRFQDERDKPEWQIEVVEYPENSRIQDVDAGRLSERVLRADRKGVYLFRIRNKGKKERSCRLNLKRIPFSPATRSFNPAVRWVEKRDTTVLNTIARMEKRKVEKRRKVQVAVDTNVVNLMDRTERIASRTNWSNSASATIKARLPALQQGKDFSTELVSWAYWIGVGGNAEKQYQEANKLAKLAKSASNAAVGLGLITGGYGALAALAIEGVSFFASPGKGDNVRFRVLGNGKLIDQGNATTAYSRQERFKDGEISIELANDNYVEALDVQVRLVAVTVRRRFREEISWEEKEAPVFDTQVSVRRIPLLSE